MSESPLPHAGAPNRSVPRPTPRPGILDVERYVPGKSSVAGKTRVWKMSSNESPLGPSPKASAAFAAAIGGLAHYPDGQARALRTAIGARFGLDPERILCGNGSDECLGLLALTYVGPGEEGIYSEHGFLLYPTAILAAGGTPVKVPERDLTTDVDAILAAVTERTRIVYITNPNNPTGTYLPFDEVKRLQAGLRPDILLVIDAAYSEYVRRNDFASGLELVATCENVVMTRTFSKIYGLAAARIGWMLAPPHVIDAVERIRPPFNINSAASAAGVAAMEDIGHIERSIRYNGEWLDWLTAEIGALGLKVTPSVANFLLIHFSDAPGRTAADADAFLQERGLILRRVASYGLPNALRLSIGTEEANRLVVAGLRDFLAS